MKDPIEYLTVGVLVLAQLGRIGITVLAAVVFIAVRRILGSHELTRLALAAAINSLMQLVYSYATLLILVRGAVGHPTTFVVWCLAAVGLFASTVMVLLEVMVLGVRVVPWLGGLYKRRETS